jgi:hypothetical protein
MASSFEVRWPKNEWFSFTILVDDGPSFSLNGISLRAFSQKVEAIETCELFGGYEPGHITSQLSRITVSTRDSRVLMLFSPPFCDGNRMISKGGEHAVFNPELFATPATFWDMFHLSQGLQFLCSLFSAFPQESTHIDGLLSVLSEILKRPHLDIESRLMKLDAFYIIADCLFQIDASLLTLNLFIKLSAISSIFKSRSSRLQYVRAIILNFEIWRRSSADTQSAVFEWWH